MGRGPKGREQGGGGDGGSWGGVVIGPRLQTAGLIESLLCVRPCVRPYVTAYLKNRSMDFSEIWYEVGTPGGLERHTAAFSNFSLVFSKTARFP